jgi:hypothetical protein
MLHVLALAGERFRQLAHDLGNARIGLLYRRPRLVDELGLDVQPALSIVMGRGFVEEGRFGRAGTIFGVARTGPGTSRLDPGKAAFVLRDQYSIEASGPLARRAIRRPRSEGGRPWPH